MKKNNMQFRRIAYAILIIWTGLAYASPATDKNSVEFLSDGGFELGVMDIEVVRFPRYSQLMGQKPPKPARLKNCALVGNAGLKLPKLRKGRWRIDSRTFSLLPARKYTLSLMIRSVKKQSQVKLEVFSGKWKRVYRHIEKIKPGLNTYSATFISSAAPVSSKNGGVSHFFRVWVNANTDLCVDAISLKGPVSSLAKPRERRLWLEPNNIMSIYRIGEQNASATIRMKDCHNCVLNYEIVDEINASVIAKGVINEKVSLNRAVADGKIKLPTDKRGFYKIKLHLFDAYGLVIDMADRAYVVINSRPGSLPGNRIFGLATEEYGLPQINALVTPNDLYALAKAIGVRSARVFAAGSPRNVSRDGKHFDFTQLNHAVATLKKYGIEPMIELGSDQIFNIPAWLLSDKEGTSVIDLFKGGALRTAKTMLRKSKKGRYFDLTKYEIYLRKIFRNLHGKVTAYEIWNEPGHKFTVEEIIRISKLTRTIQQEIDPGSTLVGFSSTAKKDLGKGVDPQHNPSFISAIINMGGLKYVDVLSYHSGSAFLFNNKYPTYANQETGYVDRLKRLLFKANKPNMPIWDSERGIAWQSMHTNMLDYIEGRKRWKYYPKTATTPMEVARKLPMVYASAIANGVRRLFWFNLVGGDSSLRQTNFRWGMFDGLLEPMPQIAVYDAMTEMIGGAKFEKLVNRKDGFQAYYFTRAGKTIILVYNWKGHAGRLELGSTGIGVTIKTFDIMGRSLKLVNHSASEKTWIPIGKWPRYVVINK